MNAKVGIVMGSDSDYPVLAKAADVLTSFGVGFEMIVASAHRTPEAALGYAESARERGLKVLIGAAGAAAHLPGVLAAKTTLPVIGLPINATSLNGLDSLYSIVQMPSGVPVATVGIDGAKNAALLAIEMLAISDETLAGKLAEYKAEMARAVKEKNQRIQSKLAAPE